MRNKEKGTVFEIGDIVRLRSNSPDMTVIYRHENGLVSCKWFNFESWEFSSDIFQPEMLKKV